MNKTLLYPIKSIDECEKYQKFIKYRLGHATKKMPLVLIALLASELKCN